MGEYIILLDIKDIASFTDYFVISSGTSDRMLDSLGDAVLIGVKSLHQKIAKSEGLARSGWIVIDYGDVVVHLMSQEQRDYYRLEDLWREGKTILRLQ